MHDVDVYLLLLGHYNIYIRELKKLSYRNSKTRGVVNIFQIRAIEVSVVQGIPLKVHNRSHKGAFVTKSTSYQRSGKIQGIDHISKFMRKTQQATSIVCIPDKIPNHMCYPLG